MNPVTGQTRRVKVPHDDADAADNSQSGYDYDTPPFRWRDGWAYVAVGHTFYVPDVGEPRYLGLASQAIPTESRLWLIDTPGGDGSLSWVRSFDGVRLSARTVVDGWAVGVVDESVILAHGEAPRIKRRFDEFEVVDPLEPDGALRSVDLGGDVDRFWMAGTTLAVEDYHHASTRLIDVTSFATLEEFRPPEFVVLSPSGEWVLAGDQLINLNDGTAEQLNLRDDPAHLSVSDDGTVMQVLDGGQAVITQHGTEDLIDLPQDTSTTSRHVSGIG